MRELNSFPRSVLRLAVAVAWVLLALPPAGWAQTSESKPEELTKQRTALYLRATRVQLADMENDVNHIGVASETCRAQYGSKACGLSDKALESDKLEDRYAYYVKGPVEARAKNHNVKVDRRNWVGSGSPPPPTAPSPSRN